MPGLAEPSPLQQEIAAQLFPPGQFPEGFPLFCSEEADFVLPPGDYGIPDVKDEELRQGNDIAEETGFGSVIGVCSFEEYEREQAWCEHTIAAHANTQTHKHTCSPSSLTSTVVLNLPVVPGEKYDKLAAVIKKIYGSIGTIREGERATRVPLCAV